MVKNLTAVIFLILALAVSCTSTGEPEMASDISIRPIHGSTLSGIEYRLGKSTSISLNSLPAAGLFLELELPADLAVAEEKWRGDQGTVHLIVQTEQGLQIGLVPTARYSGGRVSLEIELANSPRTVSTPPRGEQNVITDLGITDGGDGTVNLNWTQINTGDYDLNGQVNISDLTPLGIYMDTTYDRDAPGADETTVYWVDGDRNGQVNISDVTPIGVNFLSTVAGYNVRRNGVLLEGPVVPGPTVPSSQAETREGLPNLYDTTFDGLPSDNWKVTAVDQNGLEGADSDGGLGAANLVSSVNITGMDLFDLDGTNPGEFGEGKISSRVIDPIEEVDVIELGETQPGQQTGAFNTSGLPKARLVFLQFRYKPVLELATGAPRTGSSTGRGVSEVDDEGFVNTSIPLRVPDTEEPVEVETTIDLGTPNPDGGFFLDLTTTITSPDPLGGAPIVTTTHSLWDPANGVVSIDTDNNNNFDDEPELEDSNNDCVSDRRREQDLDDDFYDDIDDEREEIELEGVVRSFDLTTGTIEIEQIQVESGDVTFEGGVATFTFSERTQFEEKIRLPDDDIEQDIDPATIAAGDVVEVDLYQLVDASGELLPAFWCEKVDRRIDEDDDD